MIAPGILFHVPVEGSSLEMSRKASELADYYLGGSSNIRPENFDEITDMFTDAFVTYAVECFLDYAKTSQTVYQYRSVSLSVTYFHTTSVPDTPTLASTGLTLTMDCLTWVLITLMSSI